MPSKLPNLTASLAIGLTLAVVSGMSASFIAEAKGHTVACTSPVAGHASPIAEQVPVTLDELQLIDALIANHAQAIALANDGLKNAQDTQVRRIALRVAESHAGELQLLRSWRNTWYPDAGPLNLPAIDDQLLPCAQSIPYDQIFLESMISYFQAAIVLASGATDNADHAEFRTYAFSLAETRRSEIAMMEEWLHAHQQSRLESANEPACDPKHCPRPETVRTDAEHATDHRVPRLRSFHSGRFESLPEKGSRAFGLPETASFNPYPWFNISKWFRWRY